MMIYNKQCIDFSNKTVINKKHSQEPNVHDFINISLQNYRT